MTRSIRRALSALALAVTLPWACGSDDDSREGLQDLGKPCSQSDDCHEHNVNLNCANNGSDSRIYFQCSLGCNDDSRCNEYFGSEAYCLAGDSCVKKCASNSDCPTGSKCTKDQRGDFCARPRD